MELLLEHFEDVVQTEEDVEALKKTILDLAIRGKLVPQDPNDEPASVLLEKIEEEKDRLVKEKKIRKPKKLPEITDEEKPYKLPEGWEWVRLGNLVNVVSGVSYKKSDLEKGQSNAVRILRGGNIKDDKLILNHDDYFLPGSMVDIEKKVQVGDILIVASTGSKEVIGKPAYVNSHIKNTAIGAFLRIVRPITNDIADFLSLFFFSNHYRNLIREQVKGTNISNVKKEYIENMLIALPPVFEQQKIYDRLNNLFNYCDRLYEEIRTKARNAKKLRDSVFNSLSKKE